MVPTEAVPRPTGSPVALLLSAHPVPAFAVTGMATALAAAVGRGAAGCVWVALAVLSGQLCVGWSNDVIDLRRDIHAGRRDKPLAVGSATPAAAAVAAGVAGTVCVPLSLASGAVAGVVHLAAVVAALAYNAVLKRTLWSWLPYALAFALLPAFVTLGRPDHLWPPAWLWAAGALLGTGAHLTNVLPDIEADLACGVRGLPHRLGPAPSRVLAALILLSASVCLTVGPAGPVGVIGWTGVTAAIALATAATLDPKRLRSAVARLPFLLTLALSALDVALLLLRGAAVR